MLISKEATSLLEQSISSNKDTFCSGLFMSARWMVLSQVAKSGMHVIILPDKESAEYCSGDLYSIIDGDKVFFLPGSGKNIERSNYKSSLGVQRTSAIGSILAEKNIFGQLFIVTYPEALDEPIPAKSRISEALVTLKKEKKPIVTNCFQSLSRTIFQRLISSLRPVSLPCADRSWMCSRLPVMTRSEFHFSGTKSRR